MVSARDVLFVGQSADASCYHRIIQPASALGCDWCGLGAPPPPLVLGRGSRGFDLAVPDLRSYRIVVVQTPAQEAWLDLVAELQARGTAVLYEVDCDLHALVEDAETLARIETLLAACDGVICATERLAEGYAPLNPRTFVCESGVDLEAWALTRPAHDTVNIGWGGMSLFLEEILPWLEQIAAVMQAREETNFVSVGPPFADVIAGSGAVAPERCLSLPAVLPEQFPVATCLFDIAVDPPGNRAWRRGRSQLRRLESGAAGIPFVGDPETYPGIEDGVTGFHVSDPVALARTLVRLVDDPELRARVGERAQSVVRERHSLAAAASGWTRAFEAVAA